MYQEEQENLEKLRAESPLKITEIIFAEGLEPLTIGPYRLLASLPWEQLGESAFPDGRLSFFEVYIAKLFEISIYEFDRRQAIYGLTWSFFVESTTKIKNGQKLQGIYRISKQLASQVKQDFGLTNSEQTIINDWTRGLVQVDVPTLNIYDDEKISNWKKLVSNLPRLLTSELISSELIFQHPVDKELEDCKAKNPSSNGEFQCLIKAYDRWDAELNRIYNGLKLKLNSQGQEALKVAQLRWIEYRDKEFEFVNSIYPKQGAGSMSRNFNAARQVVIVKSRVLELERYLESKSSTSVEEIFRIGNA